MCTKCGTTAPHEVGTPCTSMKWPMSGISALTGRLSIKYSIPIRTGTVVKLEAKIVDQFHEMYILEGRASVDGKKVARAEARYVELRFKAHKRVKK